MYIPTCLRPFPGVRVEIEHNHPLEEVTVRFRHNNSILHEKTYLDMAWTMHAYNQELLTAAERLDQCPDPSASDKSNGKKRNRPNPQRRRRQQLKKSQSK